MRNGVSRQIDYGVFYGKSARTGNDVPNATAINQTTARVELTDSAALADEILAGYDLAVAGNENGDPNGFAFDTSYRTRSEEHTYELQSRGHLVCRLMIENKNTISI